MSAKKNIVSLSEEERAALEKVSLSTRRSVREKTRARILLLSDSCRSQEEGGSLSDLAIAALLKVSKVTVVSVRQRAAERGALGCIERQEQRRRKARKLDGEQEAKLVALACSPLPAGQAHWSLRLLRERLIELEVVEQIGLETIRSTLKKTRSSRG